MSDLTAKPGRERPGLKKIPILIKNPLEKYLFWEPGLAGSGQDWKKYWFYLGILWKSVDFESGGWPGAAGIAKSNDFN